MNLKLLFSEYGMVLDNNQIEKFEKYKSLLLEYNGKFNLTNITEDNQINIKHFLDSCLGLEFIQGDEKVIDIGSGAGFPALPLKIMRPMLQITMLDAVNKKVNFLNAVVGKLSLTDTVAYHVRAEDFAVQNKEKFDCVVARAVSAMPTLLEYCLPFLKPGGKMIAYKSEKAEEEIAISQNALKVLGGTINKKKSVFLPGGDKRTLIIIEKTKKTPPQYPRKQNKPKNNPL